MSVGLRDELYLLKGKLEQLEKELTDQMMELEIQAEKWAKLDEDAEAILKEKNHLILLDVGGTKFQTKLETLISVKDTLFYRLVLEKKLDLTKEIFIDRDPEYFHVILSFLRNKKVNLNNYSSKSLNKIREEAEFYEVADLNNNIDEVLSQVYFVKFTHNGDYRSGDQLAGTQKVEDLNNYEDRSMMKGICATSPGWIIFEINREVEFEEIEVGGWSGNSGLWGNTNGNAARVLTSIDGINFNDVGTVGSSLNSITTQKLKKSRAKYLKIQSTGYLGIGYLRIINVDESKGDKKI